MDDASLGLLQARLPLPDLGREMGPRAGPLGTHVELRHQFYGPFVFGIVTVGLIAFAFCSIGDARYRRIWPSR
jgi:hypothetical protein